MKVLCPRCKQHVDLHYLEKKGDQMSYCTKCKTVVAATYKEDRDRFYWEVYFEKPTRKPVEPGIEIGCLKLVLIAIIVGVLLAIGCCISSLPIEKPDDMPAKWFQN